MKPGFDRLLALRSLRPGARFVMRGDVITDWRGPGEQPTKEEIAAEAARLRQLDQQRADAPKPPSLEERIAALEVMTKATAEAVKMATPISERRE